MAFRRVQSGNVFARSARASIVIALCLSIGAHWAALQSVAWAMMLVQYAQQAPFTAAVAQTFDGEHPCHLCKGINAAQQTPQKRAVVAGSIKLDLICGAAETLPAQPGTDIQFASFVLAWLTRADSPAIPPPRLALS